ncbi:MAG: hypothetical protein AAFY73_11790 [Pseudomonadota bacterium]
MAFIFFDKVFGENAYRDQTAKLRVYRTKPRIAQPMRVQSEPFAFLVSDPLGEVFRDTANDRQSGADLVPTEPLRKGILNLCIKPFTIQPYNAFREVGLVAGYHIEDGTRSAQPVEKLLLALLHPRL